MGVHEEEGEGERGSLGKEATGRVVAEEEWEGTEGGEAGVSLKMFAFSVFSEDGCSLPPGLACLIDSYRPGVIIVEADSNYDVAQFNPARKVVIFCLYSGTFKCV